MRRTSRGCVRRKPLSTRVSVFLAIIVTLALLAMVASSGFAMRTWMTNQVEHSLIDSLRRATQDKSSTDQVAPLTQAAQSGSQLGANKLDEDHGPGANGKGVPEGLNGPGLAEGSLRASEINGQLTGGVIHDFDIVALSDRALQELTELPDGKRPHTVDIDGLGSFLVRVGQDTNGQRVIVGQSTAQIDTTTLALMAVESALALVIIVAASIIGRRWVVREMRPLGSVAATARHIGARDLASEKVEPFDRVPADVAVPGSEVGDVGQALNSMIDNVEGALQARAESEQKLRQFVADASHELRTPLASIQGYTQLLQKDSIEEELALSRIASESKRMSGLVEDLLLLARLDAGRELVSVPVDVLPLVLDALSDGHAAGGDHEWSLDIDEDIADEGGSFIVMGDEAGLRQILANLVTNARVHTPAGTRVTVGVRAIPVGEGDVVADAGSKRHAWRPGAGPAGSIRLSVADSGPGIPEHLRSTVFDRFVRGDSSRTRSSQAGVTATGSSGLGLSIVASLAQALGGRVDMTTSSDGTTFEVYLPRAVTDADS
ncbi:sensor histidine kinase [Schaalia vaccimaxillae]|uniref:sensor histidine kinase n=1 Tax=Schaalia vaccimaxillae TaxID=183916 RepID=UPI0003B4C39C|nr:HAMP domain-containing sensor histidine kinase [Schaalia vaccimaxillae]